MTAARIADIRKRNLAENFGQLQDRIASTVPDSISGTETAWQTVWHRSLHAFQTRVETILFRNVLLDEWIEPLVINRKAAHLTGIFGFFARLVYAVGGLFSGKSLLRHDGNLTDIIMQRFTETDSLEIAGAERHLRNEWISAARGLGLNTASLFDSASDDAAADLPALTLEETSLQIERLVAPPGALARFLLNVPAYAWIAYWAWIITAPIFRFAMPRVELASGALVMLILLMALQWMAMDKLLKRWAARFASTLKQVIAGRIVERMASALAAEPEKIGLEIAAFGSWFHAIGSCAVTRWGGLDEKTKRRMEE